MNMSKYVNVKYALNDISNLIPKEEFDELSKNPPTDKPMYYSLYYYNDEQYKEFKKTRTLKGITEVKTDNLVFDFDSPDMENAKLDTIKMLSRLNKSGYTKDNYKVYCSANKGFHIHLKLEKELSPSQVKRLAVDYFGKNLPTLDVKVYDPQRIFRLPNSLNEKSGLYKSLLTDSQLNLPIETIKGICKNKRTPDSNVLPIKINEELVKEKEHKEPRKEKSKMKERPNHWLPYKWELLNANSLKPGERDHALMVLAATCFGLGYNREIAESFLNYFDDRYANVTNQDTNAEQVDKVLTNVFHGDWKGGTYSAKTDPWLKEYCARINIKVNGQEANKIKKVGDLLSKFESFSLDFEKNILKTGIKEIDDNILFLSGTHNGILGQPGSAKTTILLRWLSNLSKEGIHSMFYSLDMAEEAIYAKLVQFVTALDFDKAVKLRKTNPIKFAEVSKQIQLEFANVEFNFTSGTSVPNIDEDIVNYEETSGFKIKFLGIDYLECIQGPYQDATANTGFISQQLKDLARTRNLCSVILLQTQKHGGEVSEPLLSMKRIKGSSAIEQSASVVLTLWREGYDPRYQEDDIYLSFAAVKNRFGKLWSDDFHWNGASGMVTSLGEEGRVALEKLRLRKKQDKTAELASGWDNI